MINYPYLPPSTSPSAAFSKNADTLLLPAGASPMYSNVLTCFKERQITLTSKTEVR